MKTCDILMNVSQPSTQSTCVISDKIFVAFYEKIPLNKGSIEFSQSRVNNEEEENMLEVICKQVYYCSILLNVLQAYIEVEAISIDALSNFQITKRINILVQDIETNIVNLRDDGVHALKMELLSELRNVFGINYFDIVSETIRNLEWTNCLKWITKPLESRSLHYESVDMDDGTEDKKRTEIEKISFEILALYIAYEGKESERTETFIRSIKIDLMNATDVKVFLSIFDITMKSKRFTHSMAIYLMGLIVELITLEPHNSNLIQDLVPALSNFIKYYKAADNDRISNVTIMIQGLLATARNFYSVDVVVGIIDSVKYYKRTYPELITGDIEKDLYDELLTFIECKSIKIQVAATKAFIFAIHPNWSKIDSLDIKQAADDYFANYFDEISENEGLKKVTPERKLVMSAVYFQLYACTLCASYNLRRKATEALMSLLHENIFSPNVVKPFIQKISQALNCSFMQQFEENLQEILSFWLNQGYTIQSFPYFVVNAPSLKIFLEVNLNYVVFAILTTKMEQLNELKTITDKTEMELIQPVLSNLVSHVTPELAIGNENALIKNILIKIKEIPGFECLLEVNLANIVGLLLRKTFDSGKFFLMICDKLQKEKELPLQ